MNKSISNLTMDRIKKLYFIFIYVIIKLLFSIKFRTKNKNRFIFPHKSYENEYKFGMELLSVIKELNIELYSSELAIGSDSNI